jgi:Protein of unknown function (DUF551)
MEWISVDDDLPEIGDIVLLYNGEQIVAGILQVATMEGEITFSQIGKWYPMIGVTHWAHFDLPV